MKTFLTGLFLLTLNFLTAKPIELNEAIAQNLIAVKTVGEGGHHGKVLKISLENLTKKGLQIKIPPGQIFHSEDTTFQDLMNVKGKYLALEKGQKRIAKLNAVCIQASCRSPKLGTVFNIGTLATGPLLEVANFIFQKGLFDENAAQSAVWAVTDGHRLETVNHPELAKFTAKTLGVEPPTYNITLQNRTIPGMPAFEYAPATLEGIFEYQLSRDEEVDFGLYNASGELVKSFFEDKLQEKGNWKFEFYFEINRLPKGKYSVRLMKGDSEIKRMEVEF